jgi:hypothetical protein
MMPFEARKSAFARHKALRQIVGFSANSPLALPCDASAKGAIVVVWRGEASHAAAALVVGHLAR